MISISTKSGDLVVLGSGIERPFSYLVELQAPTFGRLRPPCHIYVGGNSITSKVCAERKKVCAESTKVCAGTINMYAELKSVFADTKEVFAHVLEVFAGAKMSAGAR